MCIYIYIYIYTHDYSRLGNVITAASSNAKRSSARATREGFRINNSMPGSFRTSLAAAIHDTPLLGGARKCLGVFSVVFSAMAFSLAFHGLNSRSQSPTTTRNFWADSSSHIAPLAPILSYDVVLCYIITLCRIRHLYVMCVYIYIYMYRYITRSIYNYHTIQHWVTPRGSSEGGATSRTCLSYISIYDIIIIIIIILLFCYYYHYYLRSLVLLFAQLVFTIISISIYDIIIIIIIIFSLSLLLIFTFFIIIIIIIICSISIYYNH